MNSQNGKKELIIKLEEISELYANAVHIKSKMENFEPEDNYERKIPVPAVPKIKGISAEELIDFDEPETIEEISASYEEILAPKEPDKPQIKDFKEPRDYEAEKRQDKAGCLSIVGLVGAGFVILGGIFDPSVFTMALSYVIIAAFIGLFVFSKFKLNKLKAEIEKVNAEALANYNRNKDEALLQYDKDLKSYKEKREQFDVEKEAFLKEYRSWREAYLPCLKEEAEIEEKLEADRVAGVAKINQEEFAPAVAKLKDTNDLISEKYLPVISVLIDLLKSGRADDIKEAVNLYEEIVYRERQLQLEREQEEKRRQDEERRYQEEMRFREDQERQRRYEAEQSRKDEERRFNEQQRAQQEHNRAMQRAEEQRAAQERNAQRKADSDRRYAEQQQMHTCYNCRKFSSCRNIGKVIGCGAFEPKN